MWPYVPFSLLILYYTKTERQLTQAIRALGLELERQGNDTVVIVMVVNTNDLNLNKASFFDFFCRFHDECLTIPFWDFESRSRVCQYVTLTRTPQAMRVGALALDSSGIIFEVGEWFFRCYGSKAYPFSNIHYLNISIEDNITKPRLDSFYKAAHNMTIMPYLENLSLHLISLQDLLGCEFLFKIHSHESISISSVVTDKDGGEEKLVGIYLLYDGLYMNVIEKFQRQAQARDRSFEIVVIDVAMDKDPSLVLKKLKTVVKSSSWWTVDHSDNMCHTLWRVGGNEVEDKLIILPRPGFSGDLRGLEVGFSYGDDAYPFTKESILYAKLSYLKRFNLFSFLEKNKVECELGRGRETLIYFDAHDFRDDEGGFL